MSSTENKPHPHKDLIIAWANGAQIQWKHKNEVLWTDTKYPAFEPDLQYRIKPEEKKPIKRWQWTYRTSKTGMDCLSSFLYTEKEAVTEFITCYSYKKLPWTEMEFEE